MPDGSSKNNWGFTCAPNYNMSLFKHVYIYSDDSVEYIPCYPNMYSAYLRNLQTIT